MKFKLIENTKSKKIRDILFGNKDYVHTFAIISAENPDGIILSDLINSQRSNNFRKALENIRKNRLNSTYTELDSSMQFEIDGMHCQYIKFLGSYGDLEHSFFIINISFAELRSLAYKFGQKAFWYCKYNKDNTASCSYYEYRNNRYVCIETSNIIKNAESFDDYFSQRGNFKFSIWTKYLNEEYAFEYRDIINENLLLLSLTDNYNYSIKDRILNRIRSYKRL